MSDADVMGILRLRNYDESAIYIPTASGHGVFKTER